MTFTNVGYAVFLAVLTVLYYVLPRRAQNALLLCAGVVFYAFNVPRSGFWQAAVPLLLLAASVLFTFYMARAIERAARRRGLLLGAAAGVCVLVLCVFKYANFVLPALIGLTSFSLMLPLGISFYTFAAISYLVDVARGDMPAERSLLRYAVFLTFFATITSGPICRAKNLLPLLAKPRALDVQRVCDALRLALVGLFQWIAVANVLGLYVDVVFGDIAAYSGLSLILAAALYALQLYFEFAGYSSVARASAMLLGLDIPVNFKTPYFATNFSGFWNRWHISLSTWLQDYIFTPLVWSRWPERVPVLGKRMTQPPVLSSLAIVFVLSGFWHGNTWPFVAWGCLQAVYRIGEELLHRFYKKPVKKPKPALRIVKTAGVFVLWSASLVFFRVGRLADGTVRTAFAYLAGCVRGWSLSALLQETFAAIQTGFYARPIMVAAYLAFLAAVLCAAFYMDWLQCFRLKDAHASTALAAQPTARRWLAYYALLGCILVGMIMQSGGFGTVSFAYANF